MLRVLTISVIVIVLVLGFVIVIILGVVLLLVIALVIALVVSKWWELVNEWARVGEWVHENMKEKVSDWANKLASE